MEEQAEEEKIRSEELDRDLTLATEEREQNEKIIHVVQELCNHDVDEVTKFWAS